MPQVSPRSSPTARFDLLPHCPPQNQVTQIAAGKEGVQDPGRRPNYIHFLQTKCPWNPMRAKGLDSANAGVDAQSKPPAFQIIVLVSEVVDLDNTCSHMDG